MYEFSGSLWNAAVLLGHPCLGHGVSLVLALALALNLVIQVSFCAIVWEYMLEEKLGDDYLDRLLTFRLGVAHHVDYADAVGQQSLARQVCDLDPKLHTSAIHTSFIENYTEFYEGGPFLMTLALFLWMAHIIREVREALAQLHAVICTPIGPRTTMVLVGVEPEEDGVEADGLHSRRPSAGSDREHPEYLEKLTVTARLVQITRLRALFVGVGIVLPRVVLAGLLGVIGIRYLGRTGRMEDLVLNAMALSFILSIDEEFFETFLPRRVQTLIHNLEAAPLNEGRRARRLPAMEALAVLIAVLAGLGAAYVLVMDPFLSRLEQSRDILCSGQLDFVFSHNSASDVVHVTQSAREPGITETERTVLQVAQPLLGTDANWNVDSSLVALARGGQARVAVGPPAQATALAPSLDDAGFQEDSFDLVAQMSGLPVAEAAGLLPCSDFSTGLSLEWSRQTLREISGDSSMNKCDDLHWNGKPWLCGMANSTSLRALCPFTCACRQGILAWAGAFVTPGFGCPAECSKIPGQMWEKVMGNLYPCEDTAPGNFTGQGSYKPYIYQLMSMTFPHLNLHFSNYFQLYIQGVKEYITGEPLLAQGVSGGVEAMSWSEVYAPGGVPTLTPSQKESLVSHVLTGRIFDDIAAGIWNLFPGTPHPRNLTGCAYLASTEVVMAINTNLCEEDGAIASIRPWCPVACGCEGAQPGCPLACR
jgi:hypothetical protein